MSAIKLGLIGHPVEHSLSPFIHSALLAAACLPGQYKTYDIKPDDLAGQLPRLMQELNGFNCTIPHKETVIPYLDRLDHTAQYCSAVNTVWQRTGYNTDYQGFLADCPPLAGYRVLILGAGGVSRTMAYAALDSGAAVWLLARRQEQAEKLRQDISASRPEAQIRVLQSMTEFLRLQAHNRYELNYDQRPWALLNGTPLGLWPHTSGMPIDRDYLDHFQLVYDTIYNPVATRLLLAARSRNIQACSGLGMLFNQALAAQKIWHPQAVFDPQKMSEIRRQLAATVWQNYPVTLVLTGFMGSGKSTVGRLLARQLAVSFVDLDERIEQTEGKSIPDIFAQAGEKVFRQLEQRNLAECLKSSKSQVLATGGGALLEEKAEQIVRRSASQVIYLETSLDEVLQRVGSMQGRPLFDQRDKKARMELYTVRKPKYEALADLHIDGHSPPAEIVNDIISKLGL